MNSIVTQPQP